VAAVSDPVPIRASSWGGLFDCAYRWEGEQLLGMKKPAGLRAQLGTALHASTASFDSSRLPGGAAISIDEAAGVFVDTLMHPDRDVDYTKDELTVTDAARIGLSLHTSYCTDLSPKFDFMSVEAKLQPFDIDCGGGVIVRLTGTMDRARVAMTPDGPIVPDLKSGARQIDERGSVIIKGRSAQLGTYQLMLENETREPTAGAQVIALHTGAKPRVGVSPVFDAKRVMLGTDDTPGLLEHAAGMLRSGLFPPNPSSTLCSQKYCARWSSCIYREGE
jgi:hypothetical protein